MKDAKTGDELIKEFFSILKNRTDLDKDIVGILTGLYEQNKLTDKAVSTELDKLRKKFSDEN